MREERSPSSSASPHRDILMAAPDGFLMTDLEGWVLEANDAYLRMSGYGMDDLPSLNVVRLERHDPPSGAASRLSRIVERGEERSVVRHRRKDGGEFAASVTAQHTPAGGGRLVFFIQDVTARVRTDALKEVGLRAIRELDGPPERDLKDSLLRLLAVFRTHGGLDAAGIRLRSHEDFPYFVQSGFSDDFLLTEDSLHERDGEGGVCRSGSGGARLACSCGLVLSAEEESSRSLMTEGGSFWTNDSTVILALPADEDPRFRPRNRCTREGYLSMALVPIRNAGTTLGLLQLDSRSADFFTPEAIELLEGIAARIGEALLRRQADAALRENELLLREAQSLARLGTFVRDLGAGTWTASSVLLEVLGLDARAARPMKDWEDLVHPEDRVRAVAAPAVAGARYETEYRIIRAGDRSERWVREMGVFEPDARGLAAAVRGTVQDITERKKDELERADRRSKLERRLLEAAISSALDGVIVTDVCGRVRAANPRFREMWGGAERLEEAGDSAVWDAVAGHLEDPAAFLRRVRARDGADGAETVDVLRCRDGRVLELYSRPHALDGTTLGWVRSFRDVTARIEAEEARLSMERQLIQSGKLATLGEISAGLAHELRTPLNVVLTMLELMTRKLGGTAPYDGYLKNALLSVGACRELIEDFMAYASSHDPGEGRSGIVPLDVLVEECLRIFHIQKTAGVKVDVDVREGLSVRGNRKELLQVFVNLMVNAVHAMPDGGTLTISAERSPRPGLVRFVFADTGTGISEANMRRIFDPFFTTKRPGKGTGLGLSIIHRIMETHGGSIRVESKEGHGARFIGELPAAPLDESPAQTLHSSRASLPERAPEAL